MTIYAGVKMEQDATCVMVGKSNHITHYTTRLINAKIKTVGRDPAQITIHKRKKEL